MEKIVRIKNLRTGVETDVSGEEYEMLMASVHAKGCFTIVRITENSSKSPAQFINDLDKEKKPSVARNKNIEATTGDSEQ